MSDFTQSGYDNLLNFGGDITGSIQLMGLQAGSGIGGLGRPTVPLDSTNELHNPTTDTVNAEQVLGGNLIDSLILAKNAYILGGATDYDDGEGFFLGYRSLSNDNDWAFFIGNSAGNKLTYNSTDDTLTVTGTITASAGAIGGWNITTDTLYSLASGTPSASPNDGVVIDSSDPVMTIYENTEKRVEVGYLSAGVFGIKGYANDGTTTIFELSDAQQFVGGWTFDNTKLSSGSVSIDGTNETILMGAASAPLTGLGVFLGKDSSDYEFRCGDPAGNFLHWDATNLTITGSILTTLQVGSEISIQGWNYDGAFSVTDADTIAWASGTLTLMDGTTYAIDAGNTGDMAAQTFVYLDIGTSTTVLQTTTTRATAVGSGKILVAVAENDTAEASYIQFGDQSMNLDGANIVANSLTANEIAANTITANEMNVSQLSAITADMGSITAGTVTGATLQTASSGSRFVMTSSTFQGIEGGGGTTIFEIILTGGDVGDVIMGDDATTQFAKWDDSAGTFSVNGTELARENVFGDGSDGDVTIASGTTTLTSDMFYNNLTIDSGATIDTAGNRIFVLNTFDNSGTVGITAPAGNNGAAASGSTKGTGGALQSGVVGSVQGYSDSRGGIDGKDGVAGSSNGTNGTNAGTAGALLRFSNTLSNNGITGAAGGASGGGETGGTGGSADTDSNTNNSFFGSLATVTGAFNYPDTHIAPGRGWSYLGNREHGGAASGGAAVGGTSGGGGGGAASGASAQIVYIAAKTLTNSGTIKATGGNGGNGGTGGTAPAGNAGGGGGGNAGHGGDGGVLLLVYSVKNDTGSLTVTAGSAGSVGTGGAGVGTGSSGANGGAGSSGNAGTTIEIKV